MRTAFISLLSLTLSTGGIALAQGKASKAERSVATSINALACDMYLKLRETEGNLVFSPASISMALAMTYTGAKGKTARQMANVLHFKLPRRRLQRAFGAVLKNLERTGEGVTLYMANRLWGGYGEEIKQPFLDVLKENYVAALEQLDFAGRPEESVAAVNDWVTKETQGKIEKLLEHGSIDDKTVMILTNAIYFKGLWKTPFDPELTRELPFFTSPEQKVAVATMKREGKFAHRQLGDMQVLSLAYMGGRFSMLVLLPDDLDGLARIEKRLTPARLRRWSRKLRRRKVKVLLPRFEFALGTELEKILSELGMPDAFSEEKADFSGINGEKNLFLSRVVHRALIGVDEKGTEAAAATAVFVKRNGGPPEFRADHPFLFVIRDERNGQILFMGRVCDPSAS